MIYVFRVLAIFCILNLINLYIYDGGAGMEPIWMVMTAGFFLLSFRSPYSFFFSKKWFVLLSLLGLIFFLGVEGMILFNGYQTDITEQSDYIIVLGARVKGDTPSLALKYRMDKAYEYLNHHENTKAILSGGKGPGENITEAEAMRRYLTKEGIQEERLILENQSTSTVENMENSFKIIDTEQPGSKVVVVTSRFHVLRSKMIAWDLGRNVKGIGVKTMQYLVPNYYLREFFAVVVEWIR